MEEEEEPPFWLKSSGNLRRGGGRHRPSSLFLNSSVLLASLLVIASIFVFVIVPSFVSFTSQIFKPHLVKKSWDSLNLVLVLFAIVCGFLSRNNNVANQDQSEESEPHDLQKPSSSENHEDRWYGYSDRTVTAYPAMNRLRSSSSYPDLRMESQWTENGDRWRFYDDNVIGSRVFRSDLRETRPSRGGEKIDLETREVEIDTFEVRDKEVTSHSSPEPAYPPPIPSPSTRVSQSKRSDYQEIGNFEKVRPRVSQSIPQKKWSDFQEIGNFEKLRPRAPPSPPPIPSPSSRVSQSHRDYQEIGDFEKLRSRAPQPIPSPSSRVSQSHRDYQEIGDFEKLRSRAPPPIPSPSSRVSQSPPQNQRREDHEIRKIEQRTPPAPPPPPEKAAKRKAKRSHQTSDREERSESSDFEARASQPPPSGETVIKRRGGGTKDFLIALRRKKKKQRQRSVENLESFFNLHAPLSPPHAPPPPPPPPPPPSVFHALFSSKKSSNKTKTKKPPSVPPPPPPPPSAARGFRSQTKPSQSQVSTRKPPLPARISDDTVFSGNMSPLIPIPPPPPSPPFKMQAWRFKIHGDFVRINSDNSERSGSPELEDVEVSSGPSSSGNTPRAMDGGDSPARLFCPSPDVDMKADSFIARFRAGLNLERNRSNLGREPSPSPEPLGFAEDLKYMRDLKESKQALL